MIRRLILVALVVFLTTGPAARAQEGASRSWCVSVWYPSSDQPGGKESILNNLDVVNEVNPFWYAANPDGSLALIDPGAENADDLAAWRAAGLRVVPTIAHSAYQAVGPDVRPAHIQTIVDLVERMNYDGIDIDYESFPLSTRDDFSTFIEDLAAQLHAKGRLISIAVHAKTDDQGTWEGAAAQDWTRLAPAVDVFRIMTYDYHNSVSKEPGPIGPPQWSKDVLAYAASVTDLGKVRLGLHFYGYLWQGGKVTPVAWTSVQRSIQSFKLTVERDPQDMEAYLKFKVTGLPAQTIYFADAAGIAYKLNLLLTAYPTLGGVAIWGIGGEDPGNWDVLRTYSTVKCSMK